MSATDNLSSPVVLSVSVLDSVESSLRVLYILYNVQCEQQSALGRAEYSTGTA